jgi:hypothetical protein
LKKKNDKRKKKKKKKKTIHALNSSNQQLGQHETLAKRGSKGRNFLPLLQISYRTNETFYVMSVIYPAAWNIMPGA